MIKAYKYRLYPTELQKHSLNQHFGNARWIYNYALDYSTKQYVQTKKTVSRYDIQAKLPELKKEHEWLKQSNSQSLQVSLINLESSYKRFFRKQGGFPKFKSKHDKQTFGVPQKVKIDFEKQTVSIPKFKSIKVVVSRTFDGVIKSATVSKSRTNKYYISILVENNDVIPNKKPISESKAVGIDVGIKSLLVLSDGKVYDNPKYYRKSERKLQRMQRWSSRKVKGSNNRKKHNVLLATQYEKVSNQRADMWHKISRDIVSNYDTICIEDLNISGMLKNRHLSKSISDAGWGMFFTMLKYKSEWNGNNLLEIGRFEASSKICSCCGEKNNSLTLKDRSWVCSSCNTKHDRDINASINIKRFALNKITIGQDMPEFTLVENEQ